MSAAAAEYREAAKAKLKKLLNDPQKPVDASGFTEPGPELGMVQTGERPVTRARFRSGGSVTGGKTTTRVDRKPRASGGMTATDFINRDVRKANESRDGIKQDGGFKYGGGAKDGRARAHKFMGGPMQGGASPYATQGAPQAIKPGFASGGKVHYEDGPDYGSAPTHKLTRAWEAASSAPRGSIGDKYKGKIAQELTKRPPFTTGVGRKPDGSRLAKGGKVHADAAEDKKLIKSEISKHEAGCKCARCYGGRAKRATGGPINDGTRPQGGRIARKSGGAAKKGMNVNIIIAQPKSAPAMPPPGMAMPPKGIPAPPPAAMGPAAGAPPPMAPAGGAPPLMGRKDGGRTYPIKDGAGGGKGRLEKVKAYG